MKTIIIKNASDIKKGKMPCDINKAFTRKNKIKSFMDISYFLSATPTAAPPKKPILGARYLAAAEPSGPPTAPEAAPTAMLVPNPDQEKLPETTEFPRYPNPPLKAPIPAPGSPNEPDTCFTS
ncbi:hypothetical protein GVX81_10850 [[Haemophilus] felis]|nr:hypothetical protein [[Haemophilus] felis]NBI41812.1 hypothetical protein [[Haemophilus] felis]